MNKNLIASIALMLLLFCQVKAQQISILKDSVQIGEQFYVLEEIKLEGNNSNALMNIYQQIRSPHILGSYLSAMPEQRLRAKKDTLEALIANGSLREAGYGFEHYEVLYHKAGLLNLSRNIQSYGSPFESRQAYCFDLPTGKMVGKSLFVNHKALLKTVLEKLNLQKKGIKINLDALDQYEIVSDKRGKLEGIKFWITDTENYRNSGYEMFEVYLNEKEINPFLAPMFKQRLLGY